MPSITKVQQSINRPLYPLRSAKGPQNKEPTIIPNGKMEANTPAAISSTPNFLIISGKIEPKHITDTPKVNKMTQAVLKTVFLL